MRVGQVIRSEDVSGVSGTGHVADWAEFDDKSVVIRWRGKYSTTELLPSLKVAEKIHGHGGRTAFSVTASSRLSDAEGSRRNCYGDSGGGVFYFGAAPYSDFT